MERTLRTHAVRFSEFGGPEVLEVVEVPTPEPGEGEVLVEVFAAGLNPVESAVRRGDHPERWPVEFPATAGPRPRRASSIATGPGACAVLARRRGDGLRRSRRAGHARGRARARNCCRARPRCRGRWPARSTPPAPRRGPPSRVSASVRATRSSSPLRPGGVGCLAAQFARMRGATVVGTSVETRFDFLRQFGVHPDGVRAGARRAGARALSAAARSRAFLDFLGGQTHEAIALGVPRVAGAHRARLGRGRRARRRPSSPPATSSRSAGWPRSWPRVAHPPADRRRVPARRVGDAYRALDKREAPGKIVLGLRVVDYPGAAACRSPRSRSRTSRSACRRRTRTWTWRRRCRRRSATAAFAAGTARSGRKAAQHGRARRRPGEPG